MARRKKADLLLVKAAQVVSVAGTDAGPRAGAEAMNELGVIENGAVAIRRGKILALGPSEEIEATYEAGTRISCRERTVLPGFVDCHTHPVFARPRVEEFAQRCRGADYEEILASGGGIHASARALRERTLAELAAGVRRRLDRMLLHGTTGIEAKSGYGLTLKSELRSLRAIRSAASSHPITATRTFLGAHVVPAEYQGARSRYLRLVIDEMIPRVAALKLARFCDVFVEEGAFRLKEAEAILKAGIAHGLVPKVHADQFRDSGGARLAARLGAVSVEHVDATGPAGVKALAKAGVIPVLLPSASLFTGLRHVPDARRLIEAGCAVALSTDFNPGTSPTENLSLVASLGCSLLGMTPEEVVTAITRNAAAAAGLGETHGHLAAGRPAHLVVLDAPSYTYLPYRLGTNLVHRVLVDGRTVVERGRLVGVDRR